MSKKHKHNNSSAMTQAAGGGHNPSLVSEHKIIKYDLAKVLILNLVYLAVILFLYFANQRSHAVDNWFAKLLHF